MDGRIEPGDMLLQVNDVDFQNMSNDDAVRVLREMVHKPGPITLTVAKCWDPSPQGYFTLPQSKLNFVWNETETELILYWIAVSVTQFHVRDFPYCYT